MTTPAPSSRALAATVSGHLAQAGEIIDAIAEATVRAAPDAHKSLSHIDAAKAFMTAADALYEAAERVAAGEAVGSRDMLFALRMAEAKAAEGRAMLVGRV